MIDFKILGNTPIRLDSPAGSNVRDGAEYQEMQNEIAKLSVASIVASEINWQHVVDNASIILSEKSKDLMAAVYLCEGLIRTQQIDGLHLGCQILADLLENFWDSMFPPKNRMKGRLNAIDWWIEKTDKFLTGYQGSEISGKTLGELKDYLLSIDAFLSRNLDNAPILQKLISAVDTLPQIPDVQNTPKPDQTSFNQDLTINKSQTQERIPDIANPPPYDHPVSTQLAPSIQAIAVEGNKEQLLKVAFEQFIDFADQLLERSPDDPLSYKLRRIAAWSQINQAPPAVDGRSMIPDPDSHISESFQKMLTNNPGLDLVKAAESRISQHVFWLDLSFMTVKGLESLGSQYHLAAQTIAMETLFFVERIIGIDRISFADGLPFASPQTRAWLKKMKVAPSSAEHDGDDLQTIQKLIDESVRISHKKGVMDAINFLQNNLYGCGIGKDRFLLKIGILSLMTGDFQQDLVITLGHEILEEINKIHLETWDPKLALHGLSTAWSALSDKTNEEATDLIKKIFKRIILLEPAAAIRLGQGV